MASTRPAVTADDAIRTAGTTEIIGYRLRRAQLRVFQLFGDTFTDMNLSPAEFSLLVLIADNPGQKQTAVARVLGIKRANFVTLAHGLEGRGLIERRAAADDGRANALYLTKRGRTFLKRARARHETMERDLVDRVGGATARDTLFRLLDRLM